jgi:nucleolar GTP-binding protein
LDEKAIKEKMESYGVDASLMIERGRTMERGRKRERSLSRRRAADHDDEDVDADMEDVSGKSKGQIKKAKRAKFEERRRETSLARSHSRPRDPSQTGLKDESAVKVASKLEKQGRKKWTGASGEGDKRKSVHLVKWMNTGKKRMGTHYCR